MPNNYFSSDMSNILEGLQSFQPGMNLEPLKYEIDRFEVDLSNQMEDHIQEIESKPVKTMEDELRKRTILLAIVEERYSILNDLLYQTGRIPELSEYVAPIVESARIKVNRYKKRVHYVGRVKEAKELTRQLEQQKKMISKQLNHLKPVRSSSKELKQQLGKVYELLNTQPEIDFNSLVERKRSLLDQQQKVVDMVQLAKKTKGTEHYIPDYEEQYRVRQLELDALFEQEYIYFVRKIGRRSFSDYYELMKSSDAIQNITNGRLAQVHNLYDQGLASPETHTTLAEEVSQMLSHSLSEINQKRDLEGQIMDINRRQNEVSELNAMSVADIEEKFKAKSKRRKVVNVKPASKNLLQKLNLSALKKIAVAALATVTIFATGVTAVSFHQTYQNHVSQNQAILVNELSHSNYQPSVGDKIILNENAKLYSNSEEAIINVNGYEASKTVAVDKELYVTRARIFDESNNQIYTTTEYGVDLNQVAYDMGQEEGTYSIALGCSIGDENGNFIEVSPTSLNPNIEMGWVNAGDPNITVVEQLSSSLEKGGKLI